MPASSSNGSNLLDAVKKMTTEEFDAFLEEAASVRSAGRTTKLSKRESHLIQRINRGLPSDVRERFAFLTNRQKKGRLTHTEHQELLRLTHEAESQDADRAAALVELAKIRHVPVRVLMKQMGIETPAVHG